MLWDDEERPDESSAYDAIYGWYILLMGDPHSYRRRRHHLPQHLYTAPGCYFITICTFQRHSTLAAIQHNEVRLTVLGWMVEQAWLGLPEHWPQVALDQYVIMPNHLHGLVNVRTADPASGLDSFSLPKVIQGFKAEVSREFNKSAAKPGGSVWQDNYYDHIVRDEDDLERIREYIVNNPLAWHLDRENAQRSGLNPFYRELEQRRGTP